MSKQALFDLIATHLLRQNKQARAENGLCQFRGANGTKCAVGVLIPDEVYDPEMENTTVATLLEIKELSYLAQHYGFLIKLQLIHDRLKPYEWPERLKLFARENSLEYKHDLYVAPASI